MSNIINLNKARKKKARDEKEKRAEENRIKFGRTKAEKTKTLLNTEKEKQLLDGHKRGDDQDN